MCLIYEVEASRMRILFSTLTTVGLYFTSYGLFYFAQLHNNINSSDCIIIIIIIIIESISHQF